MFETTCEAALAHYDAGRHPVPCKPRGKAPIGFDWPNAWNARNSLEAYFTANPDANLGLILGDIIDIETDDAEQEAALLELFGGELPRTPNFASTRGRHYFFKADPRLLAVGQAVIYYRKIGIRVGGGGKAAQSVVPPSVNADETKRVWTLSFDDCEPATLPDAVVETILLAQRPASAAPRLAPLIGAAGPAVQAMLRLDMQDGADGSKRLFAYACRAVEWNLDDAAATAAIRRAAESKPFPKDWSDSEILQRVRDAETKTVRGLALSGINLWTAEGRTDTSNGRRFANHFGESVRWCQPWGKWLVWDGRRWASDDCCRVEALAKDVAKSLWLEVANAC